MLILYFASLRERVGTGEETLDVPGDIVTIADLANWLSTRSEGHREALANMASIRVARDQVHVEFDAPVQGALEIAFFPPVTGG
ncbi:molybdopterin converting factor subunit 1 [Gimibacter soli]|uniref:Molybdopterin converting factor subunit 1 n=1 Tax=Gimibacter soli TaxID=3024400 RepID=A0AAE9XUR0_9PROT|nr:molybdopterin converting factor subunit 1 [Gimibacter soli]WCL55461.1 molybdopterin converting factor subunit 1 [Gimibacter soli]